MICDMRSEVFTAAKIHFVTFWLMLDGKQCLGGTYCLQCQDTNEDEAGCSLGLCYPSVRFHSVITQKTTYGCDIIDIFVNCNWVVTQRQYTFTHTQYIEQHK
jgi:hypothetical protein